MDITTIIYFLISSIMLTLIPGPDLVFVITQSITQGKKAGIATALGLCTGLLFHIGAAALGISAIVYKSELIFTIIKYAGASYILYLAFKAFKNSHELIKSGKGENKDYIQLYKRGILMNILNPKVALFFLAFFPQFINVDKGSITIQMICLGGLFIIQAIIIFSIVSIFAGILGKYLFKNAVIAKRINIAQGIIFVIIGLSIVISKK